MSDETPTPPEKPPIQKANIYQLCTEAQALLKELAGTYHHPNEAAAFEKILCAIALCAKSQEQAYLAVKKLFEDQKFVMSCMANIQVEVRQIDKSANKMLDKLVKLEKKP
jgi:hypothetical protein